MINVKELRDSNIEYYIYPGYIIYSNVAVGVQG